MPDAGELTGEQTRASLAAFLTHAFAAQHVDIVDFARLPGGAIQENFALTVDIEGGPRTGRHAWVLRTNAEAAIASSLGRAAEYEVLCAAHSANVRVAEPILLCTDPRAIGRVFFIMRRLGGTAVGHKLTREAALVPDRVRLASDLGENLARLHQVRPPHPRLQAVLGDPPAAPPALVSIAQYRAYLDTLIEGQPVLEFGLRWCERHAPTDVTPCLLHRDYRTGNYLVLDGRLSGILDWEFAGWGDPNEDLGWFTARCWRFAAPELEAGGIGTIEDFLDGYVAAGGVRPGRTALVYWQVMAHLRWAIIALQQAQRHISGEQRSLELALTGRLVPELELEILHLIEGMSL